jgi:hypothetical protein
LKPRKLRKNILSLDDLSWVFNGATGIMARPVAGVAQAAAALYSGSLMKRNYNLGEDK